MAPKHINKRFKNRSLARGVSGGAPGLIFDRLLINCWKCFDVFWSCFPRILKKLRDVHFVVSVFIVCAFFVVCACAFCACVCVCRFVSCRVELCRVVSCRFLLLCVVFHVFGEKPRTMNATAQPLKARWRDWRGSASGYIFFFVAGGIVY